MRRPRCFLGLALLVCVPVVVLAATGSKTPPAPQLTTASAGEVTLTGTFHVVWGDGPPGSGITRYVYEITDDQGVSTQVLIDEKTFAPFGHPVMYNGKRVTLRATPVTRVGTELTTPTEPTVQASSIMLAAGPTAAPQAVVSGSQPFAVIGCRFSDSTGTTPEDSSYFTGLMGSSYPGLDHYWRENSYDTINLTGTSFIGWFNLPSPRATYIYDMDADGQPDADLTQLVNDCTAAADASVNFTNFKGINMMFNQTLDCCSYGGTRTLTLDGQTKTYALTWDPPWGYSSQGIVAHEMGHGFGFPHSSGPYGATYDSDWDVMSNAPGTCTTPDATYGCVGVHTISYHKDSLVGWIPSNRKLTAPEGTYHTFTLERWAQPPNNNNFLMAEIPFGSKFYTAEAREQTGYDDEVPGEGVIIHEVDPSRAVPAHVVDATNNNDPNDAGARWTTGETFNDAAHSISLAVNSASGSTYNVTITRPFVTFNSTIFSDDMEDSVTGYSPQGTWAVTSVDSHSSSHSRTDSPGGNYANNTNSSLFSPPFDLDGYATASLSFWNKRLLGTGDSVNVWLYKSDGSYIFLKSFTSSNSGWEQVTTSLNSYVGLTSLRIVFQLLSDGSGTADGWYIDDIAITGTAANSPPVGSLESAVDAADDDTTVASGGTLEVTGWAGDKDDGAPVTKVEVYVDGSLDGNATLGVSRTDVATALGDSSLNNSGWTRSVSTTGLSVGTHTVSAKAYDSDGASTTLLGTRTFTVSSGGTVTTSSLLGVTGCCPNQLVGIDAATGTLSVVASIGDATSSFLPGPAALDASNNLLYLAQRNPSRLLIVNTTTGATTTKTLSTDLLSLSYESSSSTLFGITACCSNQLVSINTSTGALTTVGTVGNSSDVFAGGVLASDSSGHRLFLAKRSSPKLVIVSTTTGAVTQVTLSKEMVALGYETSTGTLYGVTGCCSNQLVSINTSTGALTTVGTVGTSSTLLTKGAVALDPTNRLFFMMRGSTPHLMIINTSTGAVTEKTVTKDIICLAHP